MPPLTLRNRAELILGYFLAINAVEIPDRHQSKVELAREHYKKREKVIAKFQRAIDRHLNYAKHETLRNVERHFSRERGAGSRAALVSNHDLPAPSSRLLAVNAGVSADLTFNLNEFADGLLAALRNESADTLQTAGQELFDEIQYDDVWSMPDPLARKFLQERQNLLRDVPPEIFKTIETSIEEGINAGDSIREMSKRITAAFDEISQSRAMTIASTETGAAYGFARNEAMKKAGVEFKEWLTSHLPNVRPAHAFAERNPENQRVPIDEPFIVDGERLMHPGDAAGSPGNTINCHCVALAVAA
jgi:uncharacterized protein with gpF-like domain